MILRVAGHVTRIRKNEVRADRRSLHRQASLTPLIWQKHASTAGPNCSNVYPQQEGNASAKEPFNQLTQSRHPLSCCPVYFSRRRAASSCNPLTSICLSLRDSPSNNFAVAAAWSSGLIDDSSRSASMLQPNNSASSTRRTTAGIAVPRSTRATASRCRPSASATRASTSLRFVKSLLGVLAPKTFSLKPRVASCQKRDLVVFGRGLLTVNSETYGFRTFLFT